MHRLLAQNQPLMQEMFERNILNPGNPKMGELTGLHKIRENAAKVLVNYLVMLQEGFISLASIFTEEVVA